MKLPEQATPVPRSVATVQGGNNIIVSQAAFRYPDRRIPRDYCNRMAAPLRTLCYRGSMVF